MLGLCGIEASSDGGHGPLLCVCLCPDDVSCVTYTYQVYAASKRVLMAATDLGGGERVVLEARACGVPVEAIELAADNQVRCIGEGWIEEVDRVIERLHVWMVCVRECMIE